MNTKKWTSVLCAAALTLSLAACGAQTADTSASQGTLTGQVTEVDGNQVTLLLGTLEENENGSEAAPGGAPDGAPGQGDQTGTPPEKPEGSSDSGSTNNGGTPPEMPSGGQPSGAAPSGDAPQGEPPAGPGSSFTAGDESVTLDFSNTEITENGQSTELEDIEVGDVLTVEVGANNTAVSAEIVHAGGGMGGPSGGFGGSGEVTQGDSANTISEDGTYSDTAYTSNGDDENALRVDGADVTLDGVTVDKSAGATSNTENGDFYGVNAALLATNGANVTITNATVTSSAQNGNGVFSYGSGTTVNISDSAITTTADNSGGIQTTGGGTINAYTSSGDGFDSNGDLTISGGTVVVWTANTADNQPLDADGTITISGGTILAAGGSAGMGMTVSAAQPYVTFGSTGGMGGGQRPGNGQQPAAPGGANGQPPAMPDGSNGAMPPQGGGFRDVSMGSWYDEAVRYVAQKGLMSGTGQDAFSPDATITRGMLVTILYRLDGAPEVSGTCPFSDVPSGSYYEAAATWAAANGIVSGYDNGCFAPDQAVTREELAAILYRYAQYKGYDLSASADLTGFSDQASISSFARPAMS